MAPKANRVPRLWVTRTPPRRDDETTLPRMTGDAGLLTSTTTSELESAAATQAYTPLKATPTASAPPRKRTSRSQRRHEPHREGTTRPRCPG
ncbi:hypothetical protein Ctob_015799 [Chrysochromulina tobinii]|uniref:Uncharacterized protein n=1 Tax=Chrysochromulina tobinii TaxID=1460289 RepID=A0A0M0K5N3_9EUKA|nr:hypothetical protein Ctob_015799 [Chrysochromulina tobinii]|eukprot:KOO34114.1 hypothetical protein Ctob_015799 [Chrysochromulina sp. CCMP291]